VPPSFFEIGNETKLADKHIRAEKATVSNSAGFGKILAECAQFWQKGMLILAEF
jgi:hypothetical protein